MKHPALLTAATCALVLGAELSAAGPQVDPRPHPHPLTPDQIQELAEAVAVPGSVAATQPRDLTGVATPSSRVFTVSINASGENLTASVADVPLEVTGPNFKGRIMLGQVMSLQRQDGETFRIVTTNGSSFRGAIGNKELSASKLDNPIKVAWSRIQSLSVSQSAGRSAEGLLWLLTKGQDVFVVQRPEAALRVAAAPGPLEVPWKDITLAYPQADGKLAVRTTGEERFVGEPANLPRQWACPSMAAPVEVAPGELLSVSGFLPISECQATVSINSSNVWSTLTFPDHNFKVLEKKVTSGSGEVRVTALADGGTQIRLKSAQPNISVQLTVEFEPGQKGAGLLLMEHAGQGGTNITLTPRNRSALTWSNGNTRAGTSNRLEHKIDLGGR